MNNHENVMRAIYFAPSHSHMAPYGVSNDWSVVLKGKAIMEVGLLPPLSINVVTSTAFSTLSYHTILIVTTLFGDIGRDIIHAVTPGILGKIIW